MSESERRRKYRYDRVLIETARVLPSTLADAVVFLSGAQLEMLRNVTQYLRRIETYVTEYNPGYYFTPTPSDYDDILAIVADLEETLMGNPNTIWGYHDVLCDAKVNLSMPAGDSDVYSTTVPGDEVWRVFNASFSTVSATCTKITLKARIDGVFPILQEVLAPTTQQLYSFQVDITLKAGDFIFCTFSGMTLNDDAHTYMVGYKMEV